MAEEQIQLDAETVLSLTKKLATVVNDYYRERRRGPQESADDGKRVVCEVLNALAYTTALLLSGARDDDGTSNTATLFFVQTLNGVLIECQSLPVPEENILQ